MNHNLSGPNRSQRSAAAEAARKLEKLLLEGKRQAHEILQRESRLTPLTLALLNDTQLVYSPGPLQDRKAIETFVASSQLILAAHGIEAAVAAVPHWEPEPTPGPSMDSNVALSAPTNHKDYVWLFGEAPGGLCLRWSMPVLRDDQGRFHGLGPKTAINGQALASFPHMLPQRPLPEQVRTLIPDILKEIGFVRAEIKVKNKRRQTKQPICPAKNSERVRRIKTHAPIKN
jgi:hypothetical protein